MTRRDTRVVVTGLGVTTPVGGDVASTWSALLAGKSGVRRLTHDWAEQLPTQIAAEVAVDPTDVLDRVKKQLNTASNTLDSAGTRSRVMARKLRDVEVLPSELAVQVLALNGGDLEGETITDGEDA